MNKEITLGSLFDGIGGFPYAASFFGIRPLWASEIIPECISVTKKHFPEMAHVGDITKLNGDILAPVDIITFGSPCQDLSVASGQRKGLAGERSGLFLEAIRIIQEMQEATNGEYPKFAIWENVPGALSSSGRRDYKAVLEAFTKAEIPMPKSGIWANAGMVRGGGIDLAWCVYDAQYFGTAQRRRRIFLVADFRSRRAGQILFVPKSLCRYFEAGGTPRQGLTAYAKNGAGTSSGNDIMPAIAMRVRCGCEGGGKGPLLQIEKSGTLATGNDQYLFEPKQYVEILNDQGGSSISVERTEVSPTLRSQTHGNLPVVATYALQGSMIGRTDKNGPQGDGINENISFTLNTVDRHAVCIGTTQQQNEVYPEIAGTLCASGAGLSRPAGQGNELDFCVLNVPKAAAVDCRNFKETDGISGTLLAKAKSGGYSLNYQNPVRTGFLVRRLTPTEAERLQGFPDGWTKYGDDCKEISDSKRYQMLGNSIAVPCVAYIMQGIYNSLSNEEVVYA